MSNQYYFFGARTTFIQAAPKIFCRVNGALFAFNLNPNVQNFLILTEFVSQTPLYKFLMLDFPWQV